MKSAQYAGFIDASSGRFVKPGIAAREEHQAEKPDENSAIMAAMEMNPRTCIRSCRAF
jgi:hypothetical protein